MTNIAEVYIGTRAKSPVFKFQEYMRQAAMQYHGDDASLQFHILALFAVSIKATQIKDCPEFLWKYLEKNINLKYFEEIVQISDFQKDLVKRYEDLDIKMGGGHAMIENTWGAISIKYLDFIAKEFNSGLPNTPKNVKDIVCRLLCFPKGPFEFEPWLEIKDYKLNININPKDFHFGFEKQGGGLMLLPNGESSMNIIDEIWKTKWMATIPKEDIQKFEFDLLERPNGNGHITLIGSFYCNKYVDIIVELKNKYNQLLTSLDTLFIDFEGIQHTFDERFCPYKTAVTIGLNCKIAEDLKREFTKLTNEETNPGLHLTFGVIKRK